MGLGISHGVCGCLPEAPGEFDLSGLDALASPALPPIRAPTAESATLGTLQGLLPCEDTLESRKKLREKDCDARKVIVTALNEHLLFASLDQSGVEKLVDSFDYYLFNQDDLIVKEGRVGTHIFISDTPGLEVTLNAGHVADLPRGRIFGETALLGICPRSVSVIAALSNVGAWGMHAKAFREALLKSMVGRLKDNRSFLDSIPLFKELSVRQRDDVCDAARLRIVQAEESLQLRDSEIGSEYQQMFLVKSGELQVTSEESSILRVGDVVGERTLLYGNRFQLKVIAVLRSELLVVNLMRLREILGDALQPVKLLRDDCLRSLANNTSFVSLGSDQQAVALKNLEFQKIEPDVETHAPPLFVVLEGSAKVGTMDLSKGMSFGEFPEVSSENGDIVQDNASTSGGEGSPKSPKFPPFPLVAGPQGVKLAALTVRKVSMTLEEFGFDPEEVGWEDEEHRKDKNAIEISKVCVFRHLAPYQIDSLAAGVSRQRYSKTHRIINEGDEVCTHFYILMSGELDVKVGGDVIRSLSKYAYFGERALLFNEPRAASIEVASDQAEIWAICAETFKKVVQENSHTEEQLLNRLRLHDHDISLKDLEPIDVLGSGAFGVVTLVQHQGTGFLYALKQVKKANIEAMEDVKREVEILRENDHPFIMHLVKTFATRKKFYMLAEYCSGGELHAAIRTIDFALNRPQAMFYVGSLVLMLEALAERSIVYRDLKPENLMLDAKGYLKLIDFGTAKKLDPSCPRTTTKTGTPHYTAPEIFHEGNYGIEVDIWSLGVILFELLCGELPFGNELEDGPEIFDLVQKCEYTIPDGVESSGKDLINKILVLHPADRLGCGPCGFDHLKKHNFFRLTDLKYKDILDGDSHDGGKHKDYFSMLLSRELKAPLAPSVRELPDDFDAGSDVWPPSPTKPRKDTSGSASPGSPASPLSYGAFLSDMEVESALSVKVGKMNDEYVKSRSKSDPTS